MSYSSKKNLSELWDDECGLCFFAPGTLNAYSSGKFMRTVYICTGALRKFEGTDFCHSILHITHLPAKKSFLITHCYVLVLLIEKEIIRELLYQKIIITIPKNTAGIFRAGVISDFRRNGTIRRFQTYFNLIPHGNSCVGGSAYQTVKNESNSA